jgi:hypothetical protein
VPVAFNFIKRPEVIISFVGTAVDLVGWEDMSESLSSENYDELASSVRTTPTPWTSPVSSMTSSSAAEAGHTTPIKNCNENPISVYYHSNLFSEDYAMLF